MKKRILYIGGAVVLFLGLLTVIHNQLSPKSPMQASAFKSANELSNDNLADYLKNEPGKHVLFLDDGSSDAQYISTSLLVPLSLEFEDALPEIEPVLFHNNQLSVVSMKKNYKIESLPALIIIETSDENGNFNIVSSLSYNKDIPFDANELRGWFHDNNLWNGPYASN